MVRADEKRIGWQKRGSGWIAERRKSEMDVRMGLAGEGIRCLISVVSIE